MVRPGLLLLAMLLVPAFPAHAQPVPPFVTLEAEDFEGLLAPQLGLRAVNLTARVSCAIAADSIVGTTITYEIKAKPAWVAGTISPASDLVNLQQCDAGYVTARAVLTVGVTHDAPAFVPGELVVEAAVSGKAGRHVAQARSALEADYFAVLDVQVQNPLSEITPGQTVEVPLRIESFGNGPTRVAFSLLAPAPGLDVTLPEALVLGSRQHGDADTSRDILVLVRAGTNADGTHLPVRIRVEATHAERTSDSDDSADVQLLFTLRSRGFDALQTPSWGLPGTILALGLVGVLRRRA